LLLSVLWPQTLDLLIKEAREALGMKPKTALSKWTCKSFDVATSLPETLLEEHPAPIKFQKVHTNESSEEVEVLTQGSNINDTKKWAQPRSQSLSMFCW
jgi:hypothetical protein